MKKIFISLVLALALTLTACNNGVTTEQTTASQSPAQESSQTSQTEESSQTSQTPQTSQTTQASQTEESSQTSQTTQTEESSADTASEDTAPESEAPTADGLISVKGLCGEDITVTDCTEKYREMLPGVPNLPDSVYTYEGFGYYAPSDGKAECCPIEELPSSVGNPDRNFQHIDIGDNVGGLELTNADGMLLVDGGKVELCKQKLYFSGSITLKGYVYLCKGNELYAQEDELWFYPADGEWEGLPFNDPISYTSNFLGEDYDMGWYGHAPMLNLGLAPKSFRSQISEASDNIEEVTVAIRDVVLGSMIDNTDFFYHYDYTVSSATLEDMTF